MCSCLQSCVAICRHAAVSSRPNRNCCAPLIKIIKNHSNLLKGLLNFLLHCSLFFSFHLRDDRRQERTATPGAATAAALVEATDEVDDDDDEDEDDDDATVLTGAIGDWTTTSAARLLLSTSARVPCIYTSENEKFNEIIHERSHEQTHMINRCDDAHATSCAFAQDESHASMHELGSIHESKTHNGKDYQTTYQKSNILPHRQSYHLISRIPRCIHNNGI